MLNEKHKKFYRKLKEWKTINLTFVLNVCRLFFVHVQIHIYRNALYTKISQTPLMFRLFMVVISMMRTINAVNGGGVSIPIYL